MNIEADEAGRLRAFRAKYGRGWDARATEEVDEVEGEEGAESEYPEDDQGSLMDLISGYGREAEKEGTAKGKVVERDAKGEKKGRY